MPHIPQQWLDAIVYIYPTEADAREGKRLGATGFIVSTPPKDPEIPSDLGHHYIVTNDHVVRGKESLAVRINLKAGGSDVLTIPESKWVPHPDGDDVRATPLRFGSAYRYAAVNRSMMLTQAALEKWGFGPGDDVFFIGRYVDLEGQAHNVPTVRSGILSAYPAEPISQRPTRAHDQESILVEARSLSGYSGSPVFVTPAGFIQRSNEFDGAPEVRMISHGPCYLLGIDWGHSPWREPVREPPLGRPVGERTYTQGNSGMMMVVPAMKLLSLLDVRKLADMRDETERHERELRADVGRRPVLDTHHDDEYERFEDLSRRLLDVSKKDLDEKRREDG